MDSIRGCKTIVCFVKTPGFSPLKTRLASTFGKRRSEKFFRLSIKAIEETLHQLEERGFKVYWAVAEKEALVDITWQRFDCIWQGCGGLGDRLYTVQRELEGKFSQLFFIGGDSPQIRISDFLNASEDLKEVDYVLGPTFDGGYWVYGGSKYVSKNICNKVSYSCEHTFTQFMSLLQTVGKVRKLHMRGDVDFESDLRRLEIDLDTELKQIGCLSDAKNTLLNWLSAAVAVN